jgi:5-methylcytosine-specific restriction enzyme subunit McrC
MKRALLPKGQTSCLFDDLSFDVPHNRILRATVRRLSNVSELDTGLQHQLREIDRGFEHITQISLDRSSFRQIQLHRNNASYDLLLRICELIHDSLLPTEQQGRYKFADLAEDETRLNQLFEDFVRNFYAREQAIYPSVKREKIMWPSLETSDIAKHHMPEMVTDITLRNEREIFVLETKFYREVFVQYKGGRKIRSPHLYQLFAYLKNIEEEDEDARSVRGMLLYATGEEDVTLDYRFGNLAIRVATVSLAQSWKMIHARLVDLLRP